MYDPYAAFEKCHLANGVPVYVLYEPGRQFELVNFVFQAGMRDDTAVPCGTAHFLEHMICANSGMTMNEWRKFFGSVGGFFGATTGHEFTRYGFKAPIASEFFDTRLDFVAKACLNQNLSEHFSREKEVIVSEIRRKYPSIEMMTMVTDINHLHFRGLPWSGAPSAAGTLASLARITPEDVEYFRQAFYSVHNLTIVCVGGLTSEQVLEKLNRTNVATHMNGVTNYLPSALSQLPPLSETSKETTLTVGESMGLTSLYYQALLPAQVSPVLVGCAADMLTDLLYEEVRGKRGLSYQVGVSGSTLGPFHQLRIQVPDFPSAHLDEVEGLVEGLLQTFVSERVLFEQKKGEVLAHYQMKDDNLQKIWTAASRELSLIGRIKPVVEEIAECEALQFEDLHQVAEQLSLPNNLLRVTAHR